MSSYLNFYLKPKDKPDAKPMLFTSYVRGSEVYQEYKEVLNPAFTGNEDRYTELTYADAKMVSDYVKEKLDKAKQDMKNEVEAFQSLKNLSAEQVNEYIQNYKDSKRYIKELEDNAVEFQYIAQWVADIEYSDFEKVLINID